MVDSSDNSSAERRRENRYEFLLRDDALPVSGATRKTAEKWCGAMKRKTSRFLFLPTIFLLLLTSFGAAGLAPLASYSPYALNLPSSTSPSSGIAVDSQSNSSVYTAFKSYQSQTAVQTSYATQETTAISGTALFFNISASYNPVANFTFTPRTAAINLTVSFNGSASYDPDGYIVTYIWNFGDGNVTSTHGSLIFHVYATAGNHTTTLTVTDNEGLVDTVTDVIAVTEGLPPTVSFTFSPTAPYMGDIVVFDASSSAPNGGVITSYKWDFGDGSASVNETDSITTHIYTEVENYLVTLTIADSEGLSNTTARTVTINQAPVAVFTHSPAAVNNTVTFNASASHDPNGYIVSYVWNFGDGNISTVSTPIIEHVYATWGDYGVVLTVVDNQGYADTKAAIVSVADYPIASFTFSPSIPISHEIVVFDASSSAPNGGVITSYIWNFGDGNTTAITMPIITHGYLSTGNYTVTLTVTDSEGLNGSISTTVGIHAYPVASFTFNPSAPNRNDTVTFNASSSVANDGTIATYAWDLGDGSPVLNITDPVTTHIYSVAGNYTVALTVTNSAGLGNTTSCNILVGTPPVAALTYPPDFPIAGQTLIFNASNSYDPNGYIVNYTWNFGDGNTTTVTNATIDYVYAKEGNYTVSLKVTDDEGLTSTTAFIVKVRNYPSAAFTFSPQSPTAGRPITFNASSSSPHGGVITSYQWNFGQNNVTTTADPIIVYTYSAGGNYTITLTVTDSEGLNNSLSQMVTIGYPPVTLFTYSPEPSYVGDTVTFNASQSYDPDGQIVSYVWDFGDGSQPLVTIVPTTTHMYVIAGNYTSTLTVTDNGGTNSTNTSVFTVLKTPVATFTFSLSYPIAY
jgi:PKD repeat protein